MRSVSRDEALKSNSSPMTGSPYSFTINRSDWSRMGHALEPRLDSGRLWLSPRVCFLEPPNRSIETILERDLGTPAQSGARLARIGKAPFDVADARTRIETFRHLDFDIAQEPAQAFRLMPRPSSRSLLRFEIPPRRYGPPRRRG